MYKQEQQKSLNISNEEERKFLSTGCSRFCSTVWLILLATPKFPYVPESRKNGVLDGPPSEMTKSRTCHPQKMAES